MTKKHLDDFVKGIDTLVSQIDIYHTDRPYLELFHKIESSLDHLEKSSVRKKFTLRITKGKIGDKYGVKFLDAYFLNGLAFYVLNEKARKPIHIFRLKSFGYDFYSIDDERNDKYSLFGLKSVK